MAPLTVSPSQSPEWSDVIPIPQDDPPNALASIAYPDDYSEAMSYLRALMAANEFSVRALDLTETIIAMNPAHYTVWLYRAKILLEMSKHDVDGGQKRLRREVTWLNGPSLRHLKNYQIWQHRETIVDVIGSPDGEAQFLAQMCELDAKNYHVWSYRQWLVERFDLWDAGELEEVERMLEEDVRNNSAWNHRWFISFSGRDRTNRFEDEVLINRELAYVKQAIQLAPQNRSPWNYLRGLRSSSPKIVHDQLLKEFCLTFWDGEESDDMIVRSSHALEMLADIYIDSADNSDLERAMEVLDLLADRYDRIRANYWRWRKESAVRSQ